MSQGYLSFIVKTMCATPVEEAVIEVVVTDYDFKVHISTSGAHFRGWLGFTSHTVFLFMESLKLLEFALQNLHLELSSCTNKITPLDLMPVIFGLFWAARGTGFARTCIRPISQFL